MAVVGSGCAVTVPLVHPPQSVLLPCRQTDCLRVLSWNLHGLPFKRDAPERLRRVAAVVVEQRPDLVLLQEVWFGGCKRRLHDALKPDYEMVYSPRWVTRWPRGGLLMFVRKGSAWRATERSFRRYATAAPWYRLNEFDGIAGKGILAARLRNDGASLLVVDTHLQSPYAGRAYLAERRAQIEELIAFLDSQHAEEPVLIAGDFNTVSTESAYESDLSKVGDDLCRQERAKCECGTHFDDDGGRDEWIDYVFARSWKLDAQVRRIANDCIDAPYSDHDGLLVRLNYGGSGAGAPGAAP